MSKQSQLKHGYGAVLHLHEPKPKDPPPNKDWRCRCGQGQPGRVKVCRECGRLREGASPQAPRNTGQKLTINLLPVRAAHAKVRRCSGQVQDGRTQ